MNDTLTQTLERPVEGVENELALYGGPQAIQSKPGNLFTWPITTGEDEAAVLEVLRSGTMSGIGVTMEFEKELAVWQGTKYALGFNNGTAALHAAMFGCGVGAGDEVICPSITYWASIMPCFSLGATAIFADIDENTLCIDPTDIEHRITPRTKAIMVVHYLGHPCDMDPIMEIARRHGIAVIEDVSHGQGGLYKGRKMGTLGDVGAMSLMSGKSFAIGEAGMLVTDNHEIYDRAVAFGHYERFQPGMLGNETLEPYAGLPLGGYKYRMHQLSSAVGRVQLKYVDERCSEIRRSMNYFYDLLEDVPGLRPHRVDESEGSNMTGFFQPIIHYRSEELGGLSSSKFAEAVHAEGCPCVAGGSYPLHLHPVLNQCDIYHQGQPTRIANSKAPNDIRQPRGSLPVSERINNSILSVPWFKKFYPELIEEYANAYRKAAQNYQLLLEEDNETVELTGRVGLSPRK